MPILAGLATADITPSRSCELAGYPALDPDLAPKAMRGYVGRTGLSTGVHDPLLCTVMVLAESEQVALISLDTLEVDREFRRAIATEVAELGISDVVIFASHTHAGPDLTGIWEPEPDIVSETIDRVVGAVRTAASHLHPATFAVGTVDVPHGTVNRAGALQAVDRTLSVLTVRRSDRVEGVLVSFPCHPLTFDYEMRDVSADYVHYLRKTLASVYGDVHVVFANGCAGNVNPERYPFGAEKNIIPLGEERFAGWGGEESAERLGTMLGGYAVAAAAGARPLDPSPLRAVTRRVSLPRRSDDDVKTWAQYLAIRPEKLAELLAAPRVETELAGVRLGSHIILGLPGELFSSLGIDLRRRVIAAGAESATIAAYANDEISYVVPDDASADGRYENAATYLGVGAAGALVDAAAETAVGLCAG